MLETPLQGNSEIKRGGSDEEMNDDNYAQLIDLHLRDEIGLVITALSGLFQAGLDFAEGFAASVAEFLPTLPQEKVRRKCSADLRRRESAARYRRHKAEKRRAKAERKNRMLLNGGGAHS